MKIYNNLANYDVKYIVHVYQRYTRTYKILIVILITMLR